MVTFTPTRVEGRSSPERRTSTFEYRNDRERFQFSSATNKSSPGAARFRQKVCHYINITVFLFLIIALVSHWKKPTNPGKR